MRKLLVSILALAMLLGLGGLAFAAAGTIAGPAFSDIAGHEAEADLTLLAALGVFAGDTGVGGTVRPDATITRAEFCKVVVSASGKASTAAGLAGLKPTFTDGASIPTWAWGYVNCATYMGVINGYADGSFGANNPVTYGEAVTMLIRVVSGHDVQVPPGIWPYNYLFYGVDEGFVGDVDVGFASLPATRGDMARMLVATMWVQKVNKDGVKTTGLATPYDSSILGPKTATGAVTTFSLGTDSTLSVAGVALPLAAKVYVVGASTYPGLLGLNVWAVDNATGDVVAILVKQAANTVNGVFAAYLNEDTVVGNETYKLADGTKIPMLLPVGTVPGTQVTVNGAAAGPDNATTTLKPGDECVFTLGADGKATNATALRFDIAQTFLAGVTKSTATVDTSITCNTGGPYDISKTATVAINAGAIDRDALAKWDVVYLATKDGIAAYNATANPIYAIRGARQGFEGTVKSNRTVYAGTTTYYTTFEFADKSTKEYVVAVGAPGGNIGAALTSGSGKFGLDEKGKVFVQQQYAAGATSVLVKSYSTGTAGDFVTVDMRGAEVTYAADPFAWSGVVDTVGVITISATTNHATGFVTYTPAAPDYDVVAVDAANENVTLKQAGVGTILFIEDAVVYKYDEDDATYAYVPFDQIGLWVSDATHAVNVSGSLIVYCNVGTNYTLTATAGVGGSVVPTSATHLVGDLNVTITATAGAGYAFVDWTGDYPGVTNPLVIASFPASDVNVTANFADIAAPVGTLPGAAGVDNSATALVVTFDEALYIGGVAVLDTTDVATSFAAAGAVVIGTAVYNATAYTITFAFTTGAVATDTVTHNTDATALTDAAGNAYPAKVYTFDGTLWTSD